MYLCKRFRSVECIGCGDCQPDDEAEEYDDITEEDFDDEEEYGMD